jgi:hypothetical protein
MRKKGDGFGHTKAGSRRDNQATKDRVAQLAIDRAAGDTLLLLESNGEFYRLLM